MSSPSKKDVLAALEVLRAYIEGESTPVRSPIDEKVTTFNFGDGNGPVPAHRHTNPDGSTGGWVADSAYVAPTAYIGPHVRVFGNAKVSGNAMLIDSAEVSGNAWVYGNALVGGDTRVFDNAMVGGDTRFFGNALVGGDARITSGSHE